MFITLYFLSPAFPSQIHMAYILVLAQNLNISLDFLSLIISVIFKKNHSICGRYLCISRNPLMLTIVACFQKCFDYGNFKMYVQLRVPAFKSKSCFSF